MPNPINRTATSDAYTDATTITDEWLGNGGTFLVESAGVLVSMQAGGRANQNWLPEQELQPGGGAIPPGVSGIRFKSAVSGQPSIVSAAIGTPNAPVLGLNFAGTVAGAAITGSVVGATGAIAAGSGFGSVRTAAGVYVITFAVAFAATPLILANILQAAPGGVPAVSGSSPTGFTFTCPGGFDLDWNFRAEAFV